jgi:hypothetical protein
LPPIQSCKAKAKIVVKVEVGDCAELFVNCAPISENIEGERFGEILKGVGNMLLVV